MMIGLIRAVLGEPEMEGAPGMGKGRFFSPSPTPPFSANKRERGELVTKIRWKQLKE
jgi:hypothetical protein